MRTLVLNRYGYCAERPLPDGNENLATLHGGGMLGARCSARGVAGRSGTGVPHAM